MLQVTAIPAFTDNYIWCIADQRKGTAIVVDPGDATPVLQHLEQEKLQLCGILLTHHHPDHTGGIGQLTDRFKCPVYGYTEAVFPDVTQQYGDGDTFTAPESGLATTFRVITVPGHTLDHIAFYSPPDASHDEPWLFCGDTLFSGGCGRLFEGSPNQMWHSLQKLSALPDDTLVFCAHEYTLANLRFAKSVAPSDAAFSDYYQICEQQRVQGKPTVPSRLDRERSVNIFLRARENLIAARVDAEGQAPERVFAALRAAKDAF